MGPPYQRFAPGVVGPEGLPPSRPAIGPMGAMASHQMAPERPIPVYKQRAATPLWPMLVFFAFFGANLAINIMLLMDQFEDVDWSAGTGEVQQLDGGTQFALFVLNLVVGGILVWWLYRIGSNTGSYQVGLPLNAVFPIWLWLMLIIPILGLAGLILYVCWPLRQLANGICDAGSIPRPLALLGWVPMLTLVLFPISMLFWLVAPIVATVVQHIGIRKDRQAKAEFMAAIAR